MIDRRQLLLAGTAITASTLLGNRAAFADDGTAEKLSVEVDLTKPVGALDHIWSKCGGSDRANITMRDDWRQDLVRFQKEAGLERVRFHGIFNDENGVYTPILGQQKVPNWQNVDRIYDGLLERGVQPFVELGFMPQYLASGKATFGYYKANITPPTDYADWGNFLKAFVQHLIDRYGSAEVRQWYFEVWNEPNLGFFWSGTQADYFELYKASVTALKSVDPKLMVGGPSTSRIAWIPEFLAYCDSNRLPIDFVSTHLYAGDDQKAIFGAANSYTQNDVIPAGVKKVKEWIDASAYRGIPFWLTEWSSDSPAMIAHVIKGCLGVCDGMSQWTMSGTYEELGPSAYVIKEGDNGWGMTAPAGIPKPQFNTYKLLHRLGNQRLWASDGPVLASKKKDGSFAIGVWNLADVSQPKGIPGTSVIRKVVGSRKTVSVSIKGARKGQKATVTYVDQERGSPHPAWRRLGSPQYPSPAELATIRKSAELQPPATVTIGAGGVLSLDLPPECFALIELKPV
nr:hypothetical protein [Massilia sp. JS1662]